MSDWVHISEEALKDIQARLEEIKYNKDITEQKRKKKAEKKKKDYKKKILKYQRGQTRSEKVKKSVRGSILKINYGITLDDYNRMFDGQKGCCAICKKHQQNFKRLLAVDHDHLTKEVRGLLCNRCNILLGLAYDNINILNSAINYLGK